MTKLIFFLFFTLVFSSFGFAAPVTDLNLSLVSSPATIYSDENYRLTWTGGDANYIYWQFDADGNFLQFDNNVASIFLDSFDNGSLDGWSATSGSWAESGGKMSSTGGGLNTLSYDLTTSRDYSNTGFDVRVTKASSSSINFALFTISTHTGYVFTTSSSEVKFQVDNGGSRIERLVIPVGVTTGDILRWTKDTNGLLSAYKNGTLIGSIYDSNFSSVRYTFLEAAGAVDVVTDFNLLALRGNHFVQSGFSKTHTFNTGGLKTVYATVQNNDGNSSTSLTFTIPGDNNAPTISLFDINSVTGFNVSGKLNYALRCQDDLSSTIDYNLTNNGQNVYSATVSNNQTVYVNNSVLNTGNNLIMFRCTDPSGNSVSDTNVFSGASVFFYFVHNETGVSLTSGSEYTVADVNSLYVYSYGLNEYINLKATGDVNFIYSGTGDDGIVFRTSYTDPTFPTITQDFDLGALDINTIPVCFSNYQPFYEQLIYTTSIRTIKINNAVTGCNHAIAYTDYGYLDGFKLSAFTVPGPFNLYYKSSVDSNFTLLSLLTGSFEGRHNLDLIIINSQDKPSITISQDTLVASKYCQVSDCNVLSVVYHSIEPNSRVTISVMNGSNILTSTTAISPDANDVAFTWNYTGHDVNADYLTLRAIITRSDGTTDTITRLFSLDGVQGFLDPMLAIILAFGLFFFGFTLVATRFALGWWGLIIVIGSLSLLSTAPGTPIILVSQVIFIIIGIVIFITYKNETVRAI